MISLKRLLANSGGELNEAVAKQWVSGPRRPNPGWPPPGRRGSYANTFTSDASKPSKDVAVKELKELQSLINNEARYLGYITGELEKWINVREKQGTWTKREVAHIIGLVRGNKKRPLNVKILAALQALAQTVQ